MLLSSWAQDIVQNVNLPMPGDEDDIIAAAEGEDVDDDDDDDIFQGLDDL
jgi:hypothetical protein